MKVTIEVGNNFPKVRNLLEISFEKKPEQEVRDSLCVAGVKWHNSLSCWYIRNTPENLETIEKIISGELRFKRERRRRRR